MKKLHLTKFLPAFIFVWAGALRTQADISLFDFALNKDGVVTTGVVPSGSSVFDTSTGLGNLRLDFAGVGVHGGYAFFDHEMSEPVNTFSNELGTVSGVPAAGQSWEIDEPGFVFGDIYDHFLAGTLDNSIGTPDPDDVSMAMGWSFILGAGETAHIDFLLTTTAPAGGFYLRQFDPDTQENVFFSGSLSIEPGGTPVPEGGSAFGYVVLTATMLLLTRWQLDIRPQV